MKNIRFFLSGNFHFWVVKFSVYLNRRVFVMNWEQLYTVKCSRRFYGKYYQLAASALTVNITGSPYNFRRTFLVGWGNDVLG